MKKIAVLVAGLATSVMVTSGATAADVMTTMPVVTAKPAPPPTPTFSWNRFYAGVYGGLWLPTAPRAGVSFGRNFELGGHVVAGIDIAAGFWSLGPAFWEWTVLGRLGAVLGDRALVYGGAGLNADFGGPVHFTLATGFEVAVGANAALRGEVLYWDPFGALDFAVSVGFAWYFGR
jgi:opacity protein-like surface antigen